jgi:hypothetical protein
MRVLRSASASGWAERVTTAVEWSGGSALRWFVVTVGRAICDERCAEAADRFGLRVGAGDHRSLCGFRHPT